MVSLGLIGGFFFLSNFLSGILRGTWVIRINKMKQKNVSRLKIFSELLKEWYDPWTFLDLASDGLEIFFTLIKITVQWHFHFYNTSWFCAHKSINRIFQFREHDILLLRYVRSANAILLMPVQFPRMCVNVNDLQIVS